MNNRTAPLLHRAPIGLIALTLAVSAFGVAFNASRADASNIRAAGASAVAVMDLAKLLEGLAEREYMEKELNAQIEKRQAELDKVTGEITRMTDDIKVMAENDPNRIERIRDLRIKEVEARALRQFVQEQLSLEKGRMLAALFKKVQAAVADISARDGWDIVMIDDSSIDLPEMANEQQMLQMILARRVLAATDSVDITDEVRTLMNNQFNAGRP
jgi:Skp family chaperone for outer membrane proteins